MRIGGAVWRYRDIGTLVLTLVVAGLLFLLFQKTKVGLAMRAVASNGESSRLVGIPTSRILMGSWGLAGALGALAGTLHGGATGTLSSILMFNVFVLRLGGRDARRPRQPARRGRRRARCSACSRASRPSTRPDGSARR